MPGNVNFLNPGVARMADTLHPNATGHSDMTGVVLQRVPAVSLL